MDNSSAAPFLSRMDSRRKCSDSIQTDCDSRTLPSAFDFWNSNTAFSLWLLKFVWPSSPPVMCVCLKWESCRIYLRPRDEDLKDPNESYWEGGRPRRKMQLKKDGIEDGEGGLRPWESTILRKRPFGWRWRPLRGTRPKGLLKNGEEKALKSLTYIWKNLEDENP